MKIRFPLPILLAALLLAPALHAQGPAAGWRTLSTPHFRVHYPASSEAWARRAAARLESIRERVVAEVGFAPPEVVDVLVSDPIADPNGQALPFLGWPRMILWTSPPGPESEIGHYTDWTELVAVHEETHLVHLLRPSRNPARRLLEALVPLGPIPASAPRWVTEGYATVVEGRLTGSGRPNGDVRAAILRRWAQGGKLPTYARLAADSGSWRGMSMAYLLGSAYLEWLEERAGPGSLRNLWARMTARTARSFDDAFRGVFGDSPSDLYDRFRAELTWRAIEAEHRSGPPVEGELWQELSWTTGAPAISPDGTHLAAILRARDRPARLVVWSTAPMAPDDEAEKRWKEKVQKLQKEDPKDVPAVRTRPLPRKILHTWQSPDGPEPTTPRWMPDGRSILFVRFEPDTEGFLHPDIYIWRLEKGEVRRITREAGLRDPDPAPDGRWAAAVRNRDGLSQIVRLDLASGEVRALTEPTAEEVYDRPRISPDGRRLVYALHREGVWRLAIQDVGGGAQRVELAPPPDGTVSSPAWSADGRTVYAAVGLRGFIDLWAFAADPAGTGPTPLTRTQGAALAPAPAPDGSGLFFLSLQPDGFDLRRLPLSPAGTGALAAAPPPPDLPRELAPAIRPPAPPAPAPLAVAEAPPSRPYGWGRQELFPLFSGSASSSGGVAEIGLRGGDVVGRLDWLLLGALGGKGWPEGGALAATWRGWPVGVGAHLFRSRETPSRERGAPARGGLLDLDRQGVELAAGRDWQWSGGRFSFAGRALWERIDPVGDVTRNQEIASLAGDWAGYRRLGPLWRLQPGLSAHAETGRTEGSGGWSRYGGTARLAISHRSDRLALSWQRDASRDVERSFDLYQLGGPEVSLLPQSALSNRVAVPALPVGTLLGQEHESQRAELSLGFLPAPVFYERHRLWNGDGAKGDWLSLAGLEYRFSLGPMPIGRLPALDLEVGVARILDDPTGRLKDDTRWWVITVVRP
ncbi:MAG: PD40 domain-containing protein [Acidobacteria bacterium]|nr:PD40 domain-containing protein [Acidobacteriota bacterium]